MTNQISSEGWNEVKVYFDRVQQRYLDLRGMPGVNVEFALMTFRKIAERYNRGERTDALYDEMAGCQ